MKSLYKRSAREEDSKVNSKQIHCPPLLVSHLTSYRKTPLARGRNVQKIYLKLC